MAEEPKNESANQAGEHGSTPEEEADGNGKERIVVEEAGSDTSEASDGKEKRINVEAGGLNVKLREGRAYTAAMLGNIVTVSMFIFVLSSIAIIYLFVVYIPNKEVDNFEVLRSAQFLLSLAATSIVLALLARGGQSTPTTVFGFLVIAALIVSSKDVVRFALIAFGSENSYSQLFPRSENIKSQQDRTQDIANEVYSQLKKLQARMRSGEVLSDDIAAKDRVIEQIARVLRKAQQADTVARVAQKGALDTLKAIAQGGSNEWVYRYGSNEDFKANIEYLRFEGVVTAPYDDLDLLKVTSSGCDILRNLAPLSKDETYGECQGATSTASETVGEGWRRPFSLSTEVRLSFRVAEDASYEICAVPMTEKTDPTIALLDANESLLASNDDFGAERGSWLVWQLKKDTEYFLDLRDYYSEASSAVSVLINKQQSVGEIVEFCQGKLTIEGLSSITGGTVPPETLPDGEGHQTQQTAPVETPPEATEPPPAETPPEATEPPAPVPEEPPEPATAN